MTDCVHGLMEGTCALCLGTARPSGAGGSEVASVHFDTGTVELETPYNEDFVAALKSGLPSYARSWDSQRKVWIIAGEWWEKAQEIVEEFYVIDGV
jgi:hypothetical protein